MGGQMDGCRPGEGVGGGGGGPARGREQRRHLHELLVLERVVILPVRHGAGLEPAVEDSVIPPEHALALAGGDLQVVDEVAVQVVHLHRHTSSAMLPDSGRRQNPSAC